MDRRPRAVLIADVVAGTVLRAVHDRPQSANGGNKRAGRAGAHRVRLEAGGSTRSQRVSAYPSDNSRQYGAGQDNCWKYLHDRLPVKPVDCHRGDDRQRRGLPPSPQFSRGCTLFRLSRGARLLALTMTANGGCRPQDLAQPLQEVASPHGGQARSVRRSLPCSPRVNDWRPTLETRIRCDQY